MIINISALQGLAHNFVRFLLGDGKIIDTAVCSAIHWSLKSLLRASRASSSATCATTLPVSHPSCRCCPQNVGYACAISEVPKIYIAVWYLWCWGYTLYIYIVIPAILCFPLSVLMHWYCQRYYILLVITYWQLSCYLFTCNSSIQ